MLLFIHVPKTAGQHLERAFHAVYAPGQLVKDYYGYPELPQSGCHTDPLGWRRDAAALARRLPPAAEGMHNGMRGRLSLMVGPQGLGERQVN